MTQREALLALYDCINHPAKAGPKWVTYTRQQTESLLDVLKQTLELHGVEFRKPE